MKNLQDLNLVELNSQEMKETNGGIALLAAALIVLGSAAIGFAIGYFTNKN